MEIALGNGVYEFGEFSLDSSRKLLLRKTTGETIAISPKALEVLLLLAANKGRLLTKTEIMDAVWEDSFVEEANLTQTISVLRKTLGESPGEHKFIVTEPGRGYRFVANVRIAGDSERNDRDLDPEEAVSDQHAGIAADRKTRISGTASSGFYAYGAVILAASAIMAVAAYFFYLRSDNVDSKPQSAPPVKSIVILPFHVLNADEVERSLGTGMSESLIIKLSGNNGLLVKRPGILTRNVANSTPDPIQVGNELNVDAVLEATVQKAGDDVRLSVRLLRVSDGSALFAETFDDKFSNVFAVQDSIAEKVVASLSLQLSGGDRQRISKRYTENVEAYQRYFRGKYYWNKYTAEGYKKAEEHFNAAIKLDENYALAYSGLADTYMMLAVESYRDPREVCPLARAAAEKALSLDPNLAEAHVSLGMYEIFYGYDWKEAESAFQTAIKLNPQNSDARHFYCHYLQAIDDHGKAIREIREAQRIEPFSLIINSETGWAFYLAHRFDEALPILLQTRDMDPGFFLNYLPLSQTYLQKGSYDEAITQLLHAAELSDNHPAILAELAAAYTYVGRKDEAQKILRDFEAQASRGFFDPYFIATIYVALGDKENALEWMEKSYEVRSNWLTWIKVEPKLDPLRDEPRFRELIRKMNLPA